ncbi:MAG: DsbA family oxidoreductase [Gemmatimonadota bacterium]|nr:DsbA family oxidoreductase [Gemmatimonadota bacterium]
MTVPTDNRVRITVWSDYVCPFCYLQEPVLERIRAEYGERVEVERRAFELRPDPVPTLDPQGEYLRTTWDRAVYPMARQRGMTLRLPPVQPRSRNALEAAEFARDQGRFDEMHNALFRAFFEEGRDLNELDVLLDAGMSVGLDREQLRAALEEGRYTEKVLADERLAYELGVQAVPTMLVGRASDPLEAAEALSGAQPYEYVRAAVERALQGNRREKLRGTTFLPQRPTL